MTREIILGHAETLFMNNGIQGTSLGDIATAAGISKGTLFYHFRSKDDLILEIAFGHIQKVSDEILTLIGREDEALDPRALTERFLKGVLAAVLRTRLHLYLVEESVSRNEKLKTALKERYTEWQSTMIGALRPFLGEKASVMGPILLALTDGFVIQASLGVEFPPIGTMLELLMPDA